MRHRGRPLKSLQSAAQIYPVLLWLLLFISVSSTSAWGISVRGSSRVSGNSQHSLQAEAVPHLETAISVVQVSSPALFSGQAGAGSLDLMPDTEEQVAMLPNCMFFQAYPGSCIPDTAHAPCRYCRAKQFTGQYGAAQCPSYLSFSPEYQASYRWRITPTKVAKKDGYLDEHICVVEKIPGALPVGAVAAAASSVSSVSPSLLPLWIVLGVVVGGAGLGLLFFCVTSK